MFKLKTTKATCPMGEKRSLRDWKKRKGGAASIKYRNMTSSTLCPTVYTSGITAAEIRI
jgi:hypothetical protein